MQPTRARRALPLALLKARETVMSPIRRVLKNHDVTDQQWRVLRVLHENGVMDAKELAKSACVLAPSLTRMIKHLEQKNMLTLCADGKNGRRVLLGYFTFRCPVNRVCYPRSAGDLSGPK